MTLPKFRVTAIDCPDPIALADFYARLTGLEVEPLGDFPVEEVDWIELLDDQRPRLGFQKIEDYVAPTWPVGPVPQQLHVDFYVEDLDEGERHALAVGATLAQYQPGETFRVFLDPVGHPFCLVRDQAAVDDAVISEAVEATLAEFNESPAAATVAASDLGEGFAPRIEVSTPPPDQPA